jgi:hypothetical protein
MGRLFCFAQNRLRAMFGLLEEFSTYQEILSRTPKLSLVFLIKKDFL